MSRSSAHGELRRWLRLSLTIALISAACIACAAASETPAPSIDVSRLPHIAMSELQVGQCFVEYTVAGELHGGADVVPCDGPHQLEMYFSFRVRPDVRTTQPYPGDSAMFAAADKECAAAFTPYVGIDPSKSTYTFWEYTPESETWFFDWTIECALGNADRSLQPGGSARGSNH